MKKIFTLLLTLFLFVLLCVFAAAQETILMGDLDKDNKFSASDARTILRASVKLETLGEYDLFLADVDFDSKVSASDARLVLRGSVLLEARSKFEHTHESDGAGTPYDGGCTEDSYTLCTCKSCKREYKADLITAPGHAWSAWTPGDMMKHSRQCDNCNATESDWCRGSSTTVNPTCTDNGYTLFTCDICSREERNQPIQAQGHSYEEKVIAPTCTEEGYTLFKCKRCPDSYESAERVAATGHSMKQLSVSVTCTTDGYTLNYCTKCDFSEEVEPVTATGHKFNEWSDRQGVYVRSCSVCNEQETTLDWFNQTVNPLKVPGQNRQYVTCISYSHSQNTTSNAKFDDLISSAVIGILKNNLDSSETSYNQPRYNRVINHNIFPAMSKEYVSALDDADIKTITRTTGQKVNVLNDLSASYTAKNGETYDISALKNKVINNAVKVHIETVPVKAVRTGSQNGRSVYEYYNGNTKVGADTELAVERFYGIRLQDLCAEFPQKEAETASDGLSMSMELDCNTLIAAVTADWYFDAENGKPIACKYQTTNKLSQDVAMGIASGDTSFNGTFDMQTDITYNYIYLFSDYYPVE